MAAGLSAQQMRVTFEDISVSFSQEEWGYLDEGQKELYREVMKENYEILVSLGYEGINPDILSRINQEEELNVRDLQESGERAVSEPDPADNEATQEQKRKKSLVECPAEVEQISSQSGNVWKNISHGSERRNTRKQLRQELEKEQSNPAGDSPERVTECERNDRELTNIPKYPRHRRAERFFQNNNSDQVASKPHRGERKGKKSFPCYNCGKIIDITYHVLLYKGSRERALCSQCEKNVKINLNIPQKPFPCTECSKSFNYSSQLKQHSVVHSGLKPFTCTECVKSFSSMSALKRHQMVHSGKKPFTCTECNKRFIQSSQLKTHQLVHTGWKPFTCTECNKSFNQSSNLKMHQIMHSRKKPFTCTECVKSFNHMSNLKRHQMVHSGKKPFTCTECNKSFNSSSHLKRHQMVHSGLRPFMCIECNKTFISSSQLKIHQMFHSRLKPFMCIECNKTFIHSSQLKVHQMSHSGLKPFTCTECNKCFSLSSTLKRHQMIHSAHCR